MLMNLRKEKFKTFLSISVFGLYSDMKMNRKMKKRKLAAKEAMEIYFDESQAKKLHIGCGTNFLEGWLNTDLNPKPGAIFLDAGKEFPIVNEKLDYIYSEHLFEHLTPEQQLNMLRESYRVLKSGGAMRVATPSLDFLFDIYNAPLQKENREYVSWSVDSSPYLEFVDKNIKDENIHYCYVINNFFRAWGHQMIHNFTSLEKIGMQAGFSRVRKATVGESDISALQNIEKHGEVIPPEKNNLETMVVELIK